VGVKTPEKIPAKSIIGVNSAQKASLKDAQVVFNVGFGPLG
jgi:hypothetical protein